MFDQGQNRSSTLMIAYAARQTQRLWHACTSERQSRLGEVRGKSTLSYHTVFSSLPNFLATKQEYHADNTAGDCTTGFAYFCNSIQGDEATSLATRR